MTAVFVGACGVAVAGALGVVAARTPVHGVLALLAHFVGLAVLFLTLSAEFLAVAQVVVYAGAVLVLFLFVISLLTARARPVEGLADRLAYQGPMAAAAVAALTTAVLAAVGRVPAAPAAELSATFGDVRDFGRALLGDYPFELEVVGLVLLVAAVGVMVLVGRRQAPVAAPSVRRPEPAPLAEAVASRPLAQGVRRR